MAFTVASGTHDIENQKLPAINHRAYPEPDESDNSATQLKSSLAFSVDVEGPFSDRASGSPVRSTFSRGKAGNKHPFFRSRKHNGRTFGSDSYDYEHKYHEDPYGDELGPHARVWRTYLDEADYFDAETVESWKDSIDVLLVFAALFSAIVTAFAAQTSTSLKPDTMLTIASLTEEQIGLQRAADAGVPLTAIPPSALTTNSTFSPTPSDITVNALWFTSLAFSLSAALVAVLVKQWVENYVSAVSGTPLDQVRTRHFRYLGLKRWHVPAIISWLPVLLHVSLLLFFLGLVIFLQALSKIIMSIIAAVTIISCGGYVAVHIYSMLNLQCPYRTSVSINLYPTFCSLCKVAERIHSFVRTGPRSQPQLAKLEALYPNAAMLPPISFKDCEKDHIRNESDTIIGEALHWLRNASSNPTVESIVLQSLSGLQMESGVIDVLGPQFTPIFVTENIFLSCFEGNRPLYSAAKIERIARSILQFQPTVFVGAQVPDVGDLLNSLDAEQKDSRLEATLYASQHRFTSPVMIATFLDKLLEERVRLAPVVWKRLFEHAISKIKEGPQPLKQHEVNWGHVLRLHKALYRLVQRPLHTRHPHPRPAFSLRDPDIFTFDLIIDYLDTISSCEPATAPNRIVVSSNTPLPTRFTLALPSINVRAHPKLRLLEMLSRMSRYYIDVGTNDRRIDGAVPSVMVHLRRFLTSKWEPPYLSGHSSALPEVDEKKYAQLVLDLRDDLQTFLETYDGSFFAARASVFQLYDVICHELPYACHDKYPIRWSKELVRSLLRILDSLPVIITLSNLNDSQWHPPRHGQTHSLGPRVYAILNSLLRVLPHELRSNLGFEVVDVFLDEDGLRRCLQPARLHPQEFNSLLSSFISLAVRTHWRSFKSLIPEDLLLDICRWYTLIGREDEKVFETIQFGNPAILEAMRASSQDSMWIRILQTIVQVTRDPEVFDYSYSDRSRYLQGFTLLEEMKSVLFVARHDSGNSPWSVDLALYEKVSGRDLDEVPEKFAFIYGEPIHAPYTIPFSLSPLASSSGIFVDPAHEHVHFDNADSPLAVPPFTGTGSTTTISAYMYPPRPLTASASYGTDTDGTETDV